MTSTGFPWPAAAIAIAAVAPSWAGRIRSSRGAAMQRRIVTLVLTLAGVLLAVGTLGAHRAAAEAQVTSVTPDEGPPGTLITISGSGFGETQGTQEITIDGTTIKPVGVRWQDDEVVFELPKLQPDGKSKWPSRGKDIRIGLSSVPATGLQSSNFRAHSLHSSYW